MLRNRFFRKSNTSEKLRKIDKSENSGNKLKNLEKSGNPQIGFSIEFPCESRKILKNLKIPENLEIGTFHCISFFLMHSPWVQAALANF